MSASEDLVAATQARRDRDRLEHLQAEIQQLRRRVAELEHSPSRQLFAPARRIARAVSRRLNPVNPTIQPESPRSDRGFALVIDDQWPQPDHDSGSIDIVNLVLVLQKLGFSVLLAAVKQHDGAQPARDRLEASGIACLQPERTPSVASFVAEQGSAIDLCVLCRAFSGGAFLDQVQRDCGKARIVFHTVDLNWIREERRARILGETALLARIGELRAYEEHIIRASDATIVVSESERALLAEMMPGCLTVHLPIARELRPPIASFSQRRGIGFIGGFAHAPNGDAVRIFLAESWPSVRAAMPDCEFTIVGADAPGDLTQAAPGVRLLGQMPDIAPWFESLRATVAPLRYGAGAKGKVASSLAAGVPCVASPIAAEGMLLTEADGVLVAADPAAFAAAITVVCSDEAQWQRLSTGAQAYAARELAISSWQSRLDLALRRIGL